MRFIKSMMAAVVICVGLIAGVSASTPSHPEVAATVKVNLNTATVHDIQAVPGLNASKARAIVAYRKHNGPFVTLESLQKVSGFKRMDAKKLQEISQHLAVS